MLVWSDSSPDPFEAQMSLGAVRLHLRMYTKFPRPRNRFHSTNCKYTTPRAIRCRMVLLPQLLRACAARSPDSNHRACPSLASASPPPSRGVGGQTPAPISAAPTSPQINCPARQMAARTQFDPRADKLPDPPE